MAGQLILNEPVVTLSQLSIVTKNERTLQKILKYVQTTNSARVILFGNSIHQLLDIK